MKQKYPFIARLLLVFPCMILMGVVWALIGLFSIEALGKVLKETGTNLLKK